MSASGARMYTQVITKTVPLMEVRIWVRVPLASSVAAAGTLITVTTGPQFAAASTPISAITTVAFALPDHCIELYVLLSQMLDEEKNQQC